MNYSNRIWIYGPVALLLIIIIAYCAWWKFAADRVAEWLDAKNGRQVMPGVTFAFAEKDVGGFPFRIDVVLGGVTFQHIGRDGETAWRSEKLAFHVLPYDFGHYIFEAAGLQSIARPPKEPGQPARVVYVTPGLARASAILDGNNLERVDIDLDNIYVQDATLNAPAGRNARLARFQFHLRANADNTVDAVFRVDGANIGPGYSPPLGPDLKLFLLQGKLTQAQTLQTLRHGEASFFNAAEAWRAAKGILSIEDFQFQWDSVNAAAKGRLLFDDQHRVRGRIEALVGGYKALVAAAQRMGKINETEGDLASAALYAMAQLAGDAQGRLPVTFSFKDGKFKVGPITAAKLDPVY